MDNTTSANFTTFYDDFNESTYETYESVDHAVMPARMDWVILLITAINGFFMAQVFLNVSILLIFFFHQELHTSFSIYIIFLCAANLLVGANFCATVNTGIAGIIMNRDWCTLNIYTTLTFSQFPVHSHILITFNRIWSLMRPESYNQYHTKRKAWILCGMSVVFAHVTTLPLLVFNVLEWTEVSMCDISFLEKAVRPYALAVQAMLSTVPMVVTILFYPVLLHLHIRKMRQRKEEIKMQSKPQYVIGLGTNKDHPTITIVKSTESSKQQLQSQKSIIRRVKRPSGVRPFVMYTLVTISTVLCLTPASIQNNTTLFGPAEFNSPFLQYLVVALYELQPVVDPVLFAVTLRPLRVLVIMYIFKFVRWWRFLCRG